MIGATQFNVVLLRRFTPQTITVWALAASVVNGPALMGVSDRYGAVAAGRAADLIVLDADPLKDVAATRRIRAVVRDGRLLDRAALDAIDADVRAKVTAREAAARTP